MAAFQHHGSEFLCRSLEKAIERYGCPEIFNTDQGAQFTSEAFTRVLKANGISISMDGRRRLQDNIFIERLWWTLKYHYLYLRSFFNGSELRATLRCFITENGFIPLSGDFPPEQYEQRLAFLRWDLFIYRDLWEWIDHPFEVLSWVPTSV